MLTIVVPDLSASSLTSQIFRTISNIQGSKIAPMMDEDQVGN